MNMALIVNPASANGNTGRRWKRLEDEIRAELNTPFSVAMTEEPGHATRLARKFLSRGMDLIVSAGGDGTHNEVLNGFFDGDRLVNPDAALAVISLGTGGDFIRTLGWKKNVAFAVRRIKERKILKMDVGVAEFLDFAGNPVRRRFLNVVDFGMGGAVVEKVNRTTKAFGGALSFLWGILSTLFSYKSPRLIYRLDNGQEQSGMLFNFIVGNGRYYGGGIKATPHAELDDGLLDAVVISEFGRLEAVYNLPRFRRGDHLDHPKITWARAREIEARCDGTVWIDMDGECVGTLPVRFTILPRCLNLVV